jgi:two-component system response regulator QseB
MTRVLVVDDEADLGELLCENLRRSGYDAEFADSREAAIEAQEAAAFDVLVCDLNLPDGDALDVARALQIPVRLGLTGSTSLHDEQRLISAGFREVLVKPISGSALSSAIGRAVDAAAEARPTHDIKPRASPRRR